MLIVPVFGFQSKGGPESNAVKILRWILIIVTKFAELRHKNFNIAERGVKMVQSSEFKENFLGPRGPLVLPSVGPFVRPFVRKKNLDHLCTGIYAL